MERLGVRIESMSRLEIACLGEEAGGFGGVEVVVFDEGGALLDVGDVGLVVGIRVAGNGVGEGGVDGEDGASGPGALGLVVHAVFEDGLDEAVDVEGVGVSVALDEGVSEQHTQSFLKLQEVGDSGKRSIHCGDSSLEQFFGDGVRSEEGEQAQQVGGGWTPLLDLLKR